MLFDRRELIIINQRSVKKTFLIPDDIQEPDITFMSIEQQGLALLNASRAAAGVGPVVLNKVLTEYARAWSRAIVSGVVPFRHSPIADGYRYPDNVQNFLGENVGHAETLAELHQGFIDSPPHYANMIHPGFTEVGFGMYYDDGVPPHLYWTQVYSLPNEINAENNLAVGITAYDPLFKNRDPFGGAI
jgi:uncharacterized protein YkwD